MKKLLSLLLVMIMVIFSAAVMPTGVSAAEGFQEGDELFLKVENPPEWTSLSGTVLYANFTDASRAENGGKSVVIATADKSRFDPRGNVSYDSTNDVFSYTVTAADAGATAMRFWRGNNEKLWNESIVLTASDFAAGSNMVVVTDWSDTGYLTFKNEFDLEAALTLSADKGEVGDSFDISVTTTPIPPESILSAEIYINEVLVSDNGSYTFTPEANGSYAVKAVVTVKSADDKVLAIDTKSASIKIGSAPITALEPNSVYAHAASGVSDKEAWIKLYHKDSDNYYFFMPSSAKAYGSVELYNTYDSDFVINGTAVPSYGSAFFPAQADLTYNASVEVLDLSMKIQFLFSSAEAALWVNNTDSFDGFSDFFEYLQASKENSVAASGAVSTPDGKIENTSVKKMKGRGNTSWNADKKGFNITFDNTIKLAGMEKCKKFSLVSNFQDAAMARNRILFDLADEVGIPYSSDSRFIDLYTNGVYQGTYQICQKIEVGKNSLIPDFEEDDYLDTETGGVKSDFSFLAEIDSSPAADDFHFTAKNGNSLTIKAPDLTEDDTNYDAVYSYIRSKYSVLYSRLQKDNIGDYLDITSMAKVYIINELGKNWDTGASSFFFTYKPDANGNYKFFASPVWDYDNSLGNARGVRGDLNSMGITDYELPTGWFASKKGGYRGPNVLAESIRNPLIMAEVRRVWFEDFLPALDKLALTTDVRTGEIYSSNVYADILRDTAAMNYQIWPIDTNGSWTADHSSLRKYTVVYTKNAYGQVTGVELNRDNSNTQYDQYTFDGQFDYMMDWTTSRAAWISAQYIADYVPSEPTEPPTEGPTEAPTEAPTLPPEDVIAPDLTNAIAAWVFDATDKTTGDKLTEYGNADNGYAATLGEGKLSLSVSGTKSRALEWSNAEYGVSGTLMTPIMAAGSKNQWGTPYVRLDLSAKGYESLALTMYLAGSNKTPASWQLQYSADGENFTDIDGAVAVLTAEDRKLITARFSNIALPDELSDTEDIALRLIPVSMTTVEGADTSANPADGELAINYIVVSGEPVDYSDLLTGDADLNNKVDIVDATIVQRFATNLIDLDRRARKAADVTGDGKADIVDATFIQRYATGIPQPYIPTPTT